MSFSRAEWHRDKATGDLVGRLPMRPRAELRVTGKPGLGFGIAVTVRFPDAPCDPMPKYLDCTSENEAKADAILMAGAMDAAAIHCRKIGNLNVIRGLLSIAARTPSLSERQQQPAT